MLFSEAYISIDWPQRKTVMVNYHFIKYNTKYYKMVLKHDLSLIIMYINVNISLTSESVPNNTSYDK